MEVGTRYNLNIFLYIAYPVELILQLVKIQKYLYRYETCRITMVYA